MFPDRLPTVREIDRARPSLRQAYEIAAMIEGLGDYGPEVVIDRYRRQFLFQVEQLASALNMHLAPNHVGPVLAIDNTEPNTMGR